VARFIGRYEHSLDNKGRVILPAKFRPSFDTHAFLSQHHDRCLALWTPEEFEKQLEEMESIQGLGSRERNNARVWAAGSVEVEMDRQGRVPIPSYLRAFAGLEEMQPLLVTGALNRIELWNPQEWEARVLPSEANFIADEPASPPATA
jgi:MraZ protein